MRRRLAFLVSATMALVLVAFVVPLAILVKVIVADRAMTAATTAAQQLSVEVAAMPTARQLQTPVLQLQASSGLPVTVFLRSGDVVGTSVPKTASVRLAQRNHSFTVDDPGGREILVAVVSRSGGTAVIRTFVSNAELSRGVTRAWLILAGLGVVLLLLGVVVADRLLGTVTRPIGELARVSHELADGNLDARAGLAGPGEVAEVGAGLNYLAGRIRELIWQERETFADLSHRLRTPLTALRLEAESVDGGAPDGRLTSSVQALEQSVTSLIEDARRRGGRGGSCDAAQVTRERATFWSVLADDQDRPMTVRVAQGPVPVGVSATDLAAALDALLGNVFAHTPDGAGFEVRLEPRPGGGAVLIVADSGPGFGQDVDPVQRGASGGGSTGLGLDITRQTAESSGGSLTIQNGPHGAQVTAAFGPPQALRTAPYDAGREP
jgi:signal transduction histidine kinase